MMGNVFKKEYKLQQHTMLLHFQDESDACLRASEVKPKLDRFIVKKFNGKNEFKQAHASWIQTEHQNGKDVVLKYRMTIKRAAGAEIIKYGANDPQYKIPKIFYGNMSNGSNNSNKKTGLFFTNRTDEPSLILAITCFDGELKDYIDQNIAEFFTVTNFGTMQSKGFGSFTVMGDKYQCNIATALKANYHSKKCFKIVVNQSGYANEAQKTLFETVKQVYSVMKSGSRSPFYHSYIYEYMHNKYRINGSFVNTGNEKAYMKKKKVSPNRMTNSWVKRNWENRDILGVRMNDGEYRYVRALLGIGKEIKYITDDPEYFQTKRGVIQYDRRTNQPIPAKENITIVHVKNRDGELYEDGSKNRIERCSSPIFFKIVDGYIYMVAGRIDKNINGKFFLFKNRSTRGLRYRNNQTDGKVVLRVPESFDIDDFMEKFVRFYNTEYLQSDHSRNRSFMNYLIHEEV